MTPPRPTRPRRRPPRTAPTGRSRSIGSRPTGVAGAGVDSVTGKRVAGPLQGFGQLWQKTFRVRARGLDDEPAGGHRGLEGAVRDVLAEGPAVLCAAGRDRPGRGRAARHRAHAGLAGQAVHRRHGHLCGRRIVHVHHPRRPYAVGMDHLLCLSRRRRDGRPGPGPRAAVRSRSTSSPTCSAATA